MHQMQLRKEVWATFFFSLRNTAAQDLAMI